MIHLLWTSSSAKFMKFEEKDEGITPVGWSIFLTDLSFSLEKENLSMDMFQFAIN